MKKYIAKFNDKVIGKRASAANRLYAFCVAQVALDEKTYDEMVLKNIESMTPGAINNLRYEENVAAGSLGYRAATAEEMQRAAERIGGRTVEQRVAEWKAAELTRAIKHKAAFQPHVVTWCSRIDLARKELASRNSNALGVYTYEILQAVAV